MSTAIREAVRASNSEEFLDAPAAPTEGAPATEQQQPAGLLDILLYKYSVVSLFCR